MPQLSPLPWLIFVMISFVSILWVVMVSEWVLGGAELEKKSNKVEFGLKW